MLPLPDFAPGASRRSKCGILTAVVAATDGAKTEKITEKGNEETLYGSSVCRDSQDQNLSANKFQAMSVKYFKYM